MEWASFILLSAIALFVFYKYGTRKWKYWEKRGVKQTTPKIPFCGDFYSSLFGIHDPIQFSNNLYNVFKNERCGGIYILQTPMLLIRDPDLIKQIMVKDAEYFLNRYDWATDSDPLFKKNLTVLKGEEWRNLRMVMTTVFTSAKMKDMFTFMEKCGKQSAEYMASKLDKQIPNGSAGSNVLKLEIKDYFSRYGTDVIASTAFGIETNSFENPNNEFFEAGRAIGNSFSRWMSIKLFVLMTLPKVAEMLNLTFFGQKLNNFFLRTVSENISYREKHNIVRKDVIHILMEARKETSPSQNGDLVKGKLPGLTDNDIAAQAVLFYFGGFETMASMMAFVAYELAINPDIQKKLHEEIDAVIEAENGVTYNGVMNQMTYLDMIINEAMRKYPLAAQTDRTVGKPYTIPKTENYPELKLEVGDVIWIPIAGLHHDPEYFPNPTKFDPERFRNEKDTIKPFTYLPFGAGLRHCIGMRYALMEAKTGLVHLFKEFQVVPVEETEIPPSLDKNGGFLVRPKKGIHLGLKRRILY